MTKKEIVRQISEEFGLTQLQTKDIVQRTLDAIIRTLGDEGRIELRNFGVFEVKLRKARKARNPRTDAEVQVPPKFVVTFKPGKEMEERVRKLTPLPHELARLEGRANRAKKVPVEDFDDTTSSAAPAPESSGAADTASSATSPPPDNGVTPDPTVGEVPSTKKKRTKKTPQQV